MLSLRVKGDPSVAPSPRLELRQGQGLVITPQLQQAIKLLQLSNIELDAFVDAEIERNPMLVRDEGENGEESPSDSRDPIEPTGPDISIDHVSDSQATADLDISSEDRFSDSAPGDLAAESAEARSAGQIDWSKAGSGGSFDTELDFEQRLSAPLTLRDHLGRQLSIANFSATDTAIALALIDSVDEGGYLRTDLVDLSARLGVAEARVEAVLFVLQGFDPVGVMARDVRECLTLQLRDKDRLDPAMLAMLDNLELVARRDLAALRRVCSVDDEDLRDMLAELRALTPRPGAAFGSEPIHAVAPDVFVREGLGGLWHVELNTDTLPRVLVDQRYYARISGSARTDQEKTFVTECMASASWLVKSLDQRARTILKVASEIVRQQDGFLAFGVEHLRPLNLKTVADAISMHESTVSRVTTNKYIATPRGLYEMKFFFTSAIAATGSGEAHSAESVRHKIRQLVDAEARDGQVYSDDHLVEVLKQAGVDIARRTVAKYREALRIPSSVERRRRLQQTA